MVYRDVMSLYNLEKKRIILEQRDSRTKQIIQIRIFLDFEGQPMKF